MLPTCRKPRRSLLSGAVSVCRKELAREAPDAVYTALHCGIAPVKYTFTIQIRQQTRLEEQYK